MQCMLCTAHCRGFCSNDEPLLCNAGWYAAAYATGAYGAAAQGRNVRAAAGTAAKAWALGIPVRCMNSRPVILGFLATSQARSLETRWNCSASLPSQGSVR